MSYSNMGIGQIEGTTYGGNRFIDLEQGVQAGQDTSQQGIAMAQSGMTGLQSAGRAADAYAVDSQFMASQAAGSANFANVRQDQSLGAMMNAAYAQGPSAAQAQMQQGLAQTQAAMGGMAAQSRGGNQAAAMRNAQAAGSQMALQTNQQAAVLRAQEQAQRTAQQVQAQAQASQMYGARAAQNYALQSQGMSLAGQGIGMKGQFAGQGAQVGLGVGNIGSQNYATGQQALTAANTAQLQVDAAQAMEESRQKNAMIGAFVGTIGNVAGAAAAGG